jgi:hypothetical protein
VGTTLHITRIEQQYFVDRPKSAELCDLCRTGRFGNLVRIFTQRRQPRELPSSILNFLKTISLFNQIADRQLGCFLRVLNTFGGLVRECREQINRMAPHKVLIFILIETL